jgi:hypothetical protein
MKKILLVAAMAIVSAGASAQSFDNVFVMVGAGANLYSDGAVTKGSGASFAADFSVGKWFTPASGARLQWAGVSAKGWGGSTAKSFGYNAIHADYLWNISNTIFGEDDRLWSFVPFAGPGLVIGSAGKPECRFALTGGLLNKIRFTDKIDFNLEFRAVTVPGKPFPGTPLGGKLLGRTMASTTVGVTYNF